MSFGLSVFVCVYFISFHCEIAPNNQKLHKHNDNNSCAVWHPHASNWIQQMPISRWNAFPLPCFMCAIFFYSDASPICHLSCSISQAHVYISVMPKYSKSIYILHPKLKWTYTDRDTDSDTEIPLSVRTHTHMANEFGWRMYSGVFVFVCHH